jgi:hypothetical protein
MALSHWIWVPFGFLSFILVFFGLILLDLGSFWPSFFYFGFVLAFSNWI